MSITQCPLSTLRYKQPDYNAPSQPILKDNAFRQRSCKTNSTSAMGVVCDRTVASIPILSDRTENGSTSMY